CSKIAFSKQAHAIARHICHKCPFLALGGHSIMSHLMSLSGKSGHGFSRCTCLLLTQSGHRREDVSAKFYCASLRRHSCLSEQRGTDVYLQCRLCHFPPI